MNATLLLIDIQRGFDQHEHWGGARSNPEMEENAAQLLAHWRLQGLPIIHAQHESTDPNSPLHPDADGFAFKDGFAPLDGEGHVAKSVNSCFIGTGLQEMLDAAPTRDVVICGISVEHCVSTTTRMAANLGFNVTLVGDACHAWPHGGINAEAIHKTELAILDGEFATVVGLEDLVH